MQNKKQYVIPELFLTLMAEDVILASGDPETWSDASSGDNGTTTPTGWGGNW